MTFAVRTIQRDMMEREGLAEFVDHRRKVLGLTHREVAERMGNRPSNWVSQIVSRKIVNLPAPKDVERLAVALEVSEQDVLRAAGYLRSEPETPAEPWGYEPLTTEQERLVREIISQFRTGHDE